MGKDKNCISMSTDIQEGTAPGDIELNLATNNSPSTDANKQEKKTPSNAFCSSKNEKTSKDIKSLKKPYIGPIKSA